MQPNRLPVRLVIAGDVSILMKLVGDAGFEPATSAV